MCASISMQKAQRGGLLLLVGRSDEVRKATNNFASENKMRGGSGWDSSTTCYRGELPGASPGDKAIPVAVRRGSWMYLVVHSAEQLARLRHPNILPLLGFAAQSPHPNLMSLMFGGDPKYCVNPLMPVRADQPAV